MFPPCHHPTAAAETLIKLTQTATPSYRCPTDRRALGDYLYHNLAATHGSGERALSRVLKPGAWAHSPLKHRLPKIDPSVPVHFIFGDRDWMDSTVSGMVLL